MLKPMTEINVSRDGSDAPEATAAFFDEVKNGRDETTEVTGGYGSYPRIFTVTIDGSAYYGFATSLDGRAPWAVGYRDGDEQTGINTWVDEDTVLDAETLAPQPNPVKAFVNAAIEAEDDDADFVTSLFAAFDEQPFATDGGSSDDSEADDEGLGPLFE